MYQDLVSDSTIFLFAPVIFDVISNFFIDQFMRFPSTEKDWLKIEAESEELRPFPNCIVALDGKHSFISSFFSRIELLQLKGFR